jgi:hypothetical protein
VSLSLFTSRLLPCQALSLQREVEESVARSSLTRQRTPSDVKLQRLVNQLGLRQLGVALRSPFSELLFGYALLQVLVFLFLEGNRRGRQGFCPPTLAAGRVVMSRPDLEVIRQAEQRSGRLVQRRRIASREVAAGRSNVVVEERVATEDVGLEEGMSIMGTWTPERSERTLTSN